MVKPSHNDGDLTRTMVHHHIHQLARQIDKVLNVAIVTSLLVSSPGSSR